MLASLLTAGVSGVEAYPVHVEVDVSFGMPGLSMVGLPDASVRESRDRVRSAIRNSGFEFPKHRITINLAPADRRKIGSSFDLPIALGILAAAGALARQHLNDFVLLGELSLDGSIHPTRGVLPIAAAARRDGLTGILLPAPNASEAAIVEGLQVVAVSTLVEAAAVLNQPGPIVGGAPSVVSTSKGRATLDLADVHGQVLARRALEVAAAGEHNLLFVGPPGAGKTMMAQRLPGILPPLSFDEALEVTAVQSVAGLVPAGSGLVTVRPFRSPHHTISNVALVGGGSQPRPGEVSLAHNGVLFLDEMPEFGRFALEALRQPVEDGRVLVARATRSAIFPARIMLVGAMNPCPCGYLGHEDRPCRCTPAQVARYRGRLSGPLRDRMDLTVDVPALPLQVLGSRPVAESSADVRQRVMKARERQVLRYEASKGDDASNGYDFGGVGTNAHLTPALLANHCALDRAGSRLLDTAVTRLSLSARAYHRVLKVARTIADLEASDRIEAEHLAEALQFRMRE